MSCFYRPFLLERLCCHFLGNCNKLLQQNNGFQATLKKSWIIIAPWEILPSREVTGKTDKKVETGVPQTISSFKKAHNWCCFSTHITLQSLVIADKANTNSRIFQDAFFFLKYKLRRHSLSLHSIAADGETGSVALDFSNNIDCMWKWTLYLFVVFSGYL